MWLQAPKPWLFLYEIGKNKTKEKTTSVSETLLLNQCLDLLMQFAEEQGIGYLRSSCCLHCIYCEDHLVT